MYYTILYCTVLYYTVLYCTILYCTVLYYTILYYTILYYTILYYRYSTWISFLLVMYPSGMEPRIPTPLAPPSPYINVTEGSRANGQCNIEIAKAAYLYICYGLQNETFGDLNKDTNCALCMGNSEGLCATMRAKPHWNIYRTVTDRCSSTIRTNFSINHTSVEDNGKIFCVWGDDVFPMQNYANFSLNVERKKMSDLQLAMYVGAPLAALTIVGLVTSLVVVVRKKLKQRHSPPLNSPGMCKPKFYQDST